MNHPDHFAKVKSAFFPQNRRVPWDLGSPWPYLADITPYRPRSHGCGPWFNSTVGLHPLLWVTLGTREASRPFGPFTQVSSTSLQVLLPIPSHLNIPTNPTPYTPYPISTLSILVSPLFYPSQACLMAIRTMNTICYLDILFGCALKLSTLLRHYNIYLF